MMAAEFILPGRPVDRVGLVEEVTTVDPLAVGPDPAAALAHEDRFGEAVGDLALSETTVVDEHALFGIIGRCDPFARQATVIGMAHRF